MPTRPLAVLLTVAAMTGCGQPEEPQSAAPARQAHYEASPAELKAVAAVAERFVRAVVGGDPSGASALLTSAARTRYQSDPSILPMMGLEVESVAAGATRLLDEDEAGAEVEVTEAGASTPSTLACLLKRETAGWRVCGLASAAEGDQPVVISFEAPVAAQPGAQPLVGGADAAAQRTAAGKTDSQTK